MDPNQARRVDVGVEGDEPKKRLEVGPNASADDLLQVVNEVGVAERVEAVVPSVEAVSKTELVHAFRNPYVHTTGDVFKRFQHFAGKPRTKLGKAALALLRDPEVVEAYRSTVSHILSSSAPQGHASVDLRIMFRFFYPGMDLSEFSDKFETFIASELQHVVFFDGLNDILDNAKRFNLRLNPDSLKIQAALTEARRKNSKDVMDRFQLKRIEEFAAKHGFSFGN
ncbi:MAG: hypothetical protein US89_C0006G0025 [Candidatus Peregrinibacteria bacterium GW2011_GWF2_38_29]|nr:MAG: hypothetical protein US89_C0006G0025 [Candidatus Peregrinibacteria bacterium GW2011_GWF2_38_29]HBB03215.1 hypothetical protein [Candidatus Peregrinibacteria bacterium]